MAIGTGESRRAGMSRQSFWLVKGGLRLLLAGLFIASGVLKLLDPSKFATIISGFGLLPHPLIMPVAITLPVAELAAGIGLVFCRRGSLVAIAIMLVLFMAVLAYGIHLGLDIDCGCFGPEDPEQAYKGLKGALMRDAAMMAAVLFLFWSRDRSQWRSGRLQP